MYDAKNKTRDERQVIADAVQRAVEKAKAVDGLAVDFSGTHSLSDDLESSVEPAVIFGSKEMADCVVSLKKEVGPRQSFSISSVCKDSLNAGGIGVSLGA